MDIWIINPYDGTPEQQATRTYEYAKQLVRRGHKISVYASSFSHYKFTEEKLAPGERWKVEYFDGIRFIWLRTTPYKCNNWRRATNMLSHALMAFVLGMRFKEKPDIIMGTSVPIFAGLCAYILSHLKHARFFFEVRDLWPQTLVDLGAISEKSLITLGMRSIEKLLYHKAEKIIVVLPYAAEYITSLGFSPDKIAWLPNGIDMNNYDITKQYDGGTSEEFTLMYIGGFASYHGIEVILQAAKKLEKKHREDLRFVFIGDGPEKKRLIQYAKDLNLSNVQFRDLIPKREIPKAIGEADACIAVIRRLPVLKYGINPNKLFDYMASGRPILFAIDSRYNPVADADAGITVPAEDADALSEAITKLIMMTPEERKRMGRNGFNYIKNHFDINIISAKLETLL